MPFKGWREKEEPAKETKNEQLLQCSEKKKKEEWSTRCPVKKVFSKGKLLSQTHR